MMENKGRRQQLKELRSQRPHDQRDRSRTPRRNDWDEGDEDYFSVEKIRRAERVKVAPRPSQSAADEPQPETNGTVIEIRSGDSLVMYEGRIIQASLPRSARVPLQGSARTSYAARSPLAVGDRVQLEAGGSVQPAAGSSEIARIVAIAPRRSALSRDATIGGGPETAHVLAANIDQVVIVCSPAEPPFRPRLIDRYLVAASRDGLGAVVCLNKTDLGVPSAVEASLAGYSKLGIDIVRTSATAGDGIDAARACIAGKVSLFTGHSGVGKSSLLNALEPGLSLRVGDVTESTAGQGKGRHTTSSARLLPLSMPETFVVDTPGIRSFGVRGMAARELATHFPDIAALATGCAFGDCRHRAEPDCAVRAGAHLDPVKSVHAAMISRAGSPTCTPPKSITALRRPPATRTFPANRSPWTHTGVPSHPGARSAVSHAAVTESVSIMPCEAAIAART